MDNFNLGDEVHWLQRFRQGSASASAEGSLSLTIPDEVNVPDLDPYEADNMLNTLLESLMENPVSITQSQLQQYHTLKSFLKYFKDLSNSLKSKLLEVILSGLKEQIKLTKASILMEDAPDDPSHPDQDATAPSLIDDRYTLEMLIFLLHWFTLSAETMMADQLQEEKHTGVGKPKKSKAKKQQALSHDFVWDQSRLDCLKVMTSLLSVNLNRVWSISNERLVVITLITKPVYSMMEIPTFVISTSSKEAAFEIISLCISRYQHGNEAKITFLQNLTYYDHLSESLAELLGHLATEHDVLDLTDDILREISQMSFQQDNTMTKSFARFLIKLAEIVPTQVSKSISLIKGLLDVESYTIRCAMIELIGLVIGKSLILDLNDAPHTRKQQHQNLFNILIERFQDISSFCRIRVIHTCIYLCDTRTPSSTERHCVTGIPLHERSKLVGCVIERLRDKSNLVRKAAIKLLVKLIETHPFIKDGGELNLKDLIERKRQVQEKLDTFIRDAPADVSPPDDNDQEDANDPVAEATTSATDGTDKAAVEAPSVKQRRSLGGALSLPMSHQDGASSPSLTDEQSRIQRQNLAQLEWKYYDDAVQFVTTLTSAMHDMCELIASTTKSDVIEAMSFFMVAHEYKIEGAQEGIRKMVHLIWHKDTADNEAKSVKEHLLQVYKKLYIDTDLRLSVQQGTKQVVKEIINLTINRNLAELTSLEEVISTMQSKGFISEHIIAQLWTEFNTPVSISKEQRVGALRILSMLGKKSKDIISENVTTILQIGLGTCGKQNPELARCACIALNNLSGQQRKVKGSLSQETVRISNDNVIFDRLVEIIQTKISIYEWFGVAEQAINAIYTLAEHPGDICTSLIQKFMNDLLEAEEMSELPTEPTDSQLSESSGSSQIHSQSQSQSQFDHGSQPKMKRYKSSSVLTRLLFIVGHVAIKQIVHLEVLESQWKRKHNDINKALVAPPEAVTTTTRTPINKNAERNQAMSTIRNKVKKTQQKGSNPSSTTGSTAADDSNELDQVAGNNEDEVGDAILFIREKELLYGKESLLALFGPIVSHICTANKVYNSRPLQIAATLALCKFMCVSFQYCEEHLQLLFTILAKSKDPIIRSNIVIALGDMAICFNNLIDDNIAYLYDRLGDQDPHVKKNGLMVLSHLILNGMIKVKGQISEISKCLEDPDPSISDLAKLFFTELSMKENAIYNNLPDMISNLSSCPETEFGEDKFQRVMKFLFEFVQKAAQTENLVEKLCHRFRNATEPRQWRDIMYCLSLLPYKSEKSVKKLAENLPFYQSTLYEKTVWSLITEILQKVRRATTTKTETKQFLDDFEKRLKEQHEKAVDDYQSLMKAKQSKLPKERREALKEGEDAIKDGSVAESATPNDEGPVDEVDHAQETPSGDSVEQTVTLLKNMKLDDRPVEKENNIVAVTSPSTIQKAATIRISPATRLRESPGSRRHSESNLSKTTELTTPMKAANEAIATRNASTVLPMAKTRTDLSTRSRVLRPATVNNKSNLPAQSKASIKSPTTSTLKSKATVTPDKVTPSTLTTPRPVTQRKIPPATTSASTRRVKETPIRASALPSAAPSTEVRSSRMSTRPTRSSQENNATLLPPLVAVKAESKTSGIPPKRIAKTTTTSEIVRPAPTQRLRKPIK